MPNKIFCPVCQISFIPRQSVTVGEVVICPICAAKLEVTGIGDQIESRLLPQAPRDEIYQRVDEYARLKGHTFKESREEIMEGLLRKKELFGEFYCPCRFDHTPENICPCQETRQGRVNREGSCY